MHGLIPRLAPLSLDTLGLAATLEGLVRDWQRRYPSITLSLHQQLAMDLGPSVALAIYRVAQEGLINALRHSQATHIDLDVQSDAERVIITITDDGVGLPEDWSLPGHFGLRGLAERVKHLGGALHVTNRERRGVELSAQIPMAGGA
jgi:two-component system sensor histidine kinase UhpB